MAETATWSGTVSFGLVNINAKLVKATEDAKTISFNQINKNTGNRIRYRKVDEVTGEDVSYDDIVKGYQVDKDKYLLVESEELDALAPTRSSSLDIIHFVPRNSLDVIYFDNPYFLKTDAASYKAYTLLFQGLIQRNMVAIGKLVLRSKEHLVAIHPAREDGGLVLHTLRWHAQVREFDNTPVSVTSEAELELVNALIDVLTLENFDITQYSSDYDEQIRELLDAKARGEDVVTAGKVEDAPLPMDDVFEALRLSLLQQKQTTTE